MLKHLKQFLFLVIILLSAINNLYFSSFFLSLTFLVILYNPLYSILLCIMIYFKAEFAYYFLFIAISLFQVFLKNFRFKTILSYLALICLTFILYQINQNKANFILSIFLLTFFLIILIVLSNKLKDPFSFYPLVLGLSLGLIFFSPNKLLASFLLSSLVANTSMLIIPFILILLNSNNNFLIISLIFELTSLNFIKKPLPFILLLIFLTPYLYHLSPYYLLTLIYPLVNFLTPKTKFLLTNKTTNFDNYLNYLNTKKSDDTDYETLDEQIQTLIRTYCINCQKRQLCFKKKRLNYYQYLLFLSTANMKQTKPILDFINNCDYYEAMSYTKKTNLIQIKHNQDLSFLDSMLHYEDSDYTKIINFFNKTPYNLEKVYNQTRSSIDYTFEFKTKPYFLKIIEKQLSFRLNKKVIFTLQNDKYTLKEKPLYKLCYDTLVLAKGNVYISGDNILIKSYQSDYYFALSDGMGSGLKAFQASKAMLQELDGLINLNLSDELILKPLMTHFKMAGFNDTYATLDFIHFNLTTLNINLYKVASSETFIISNNKLFTYKTDSLPIHLASDITKHELKLKIGDTILLASDGLSLVDQNKLSSFIKANAYLEPNKLVYDLAKYVFSEQNNKLEDDISLIAIKILPIV